MGVDLYSFILTSSLYNIITGSCQATPSNQKQYPSNRLAERYFVYLDQHANHALNMLVTC